MKTIRKLIGVVLMGAFAVLTFLAYRDSRGPRAYLRRKWAIEATFAVVAAISGLMLLAGDDDD